MSDDVARVVGAGSPTTINIKGKECRPRPLTLKELGELERDCLIRYRKAYVQSHHDNLEYLPASTNSDEYISRKIDEAAKFDLKSLPPRFAYDPKKIQLTDKLKVWLERNMDGYFPDKPGAKGIDATLKSIAAMALDGEFLKEEEYKELTGVEPKRTRVGYVNWWTTGTFDGRLSMTWLAFRDAGVTRDEISEALGPNPTILLEMAREIETLTAPAVGNG